MDRRTFLTAVASALSLPIIARKKKEVFSTGIPTLDKHFNGGFHPGHLYVVYGNSRDYLYSSILNANKDITFIEEKHDEGNSSELSLHCEGPSFSNIGTKDQFTDYKITSTIKNSLWDKPQCKILFIPPWTEPGHFLYCSYSFLRPVDGAICIKNKNLFILKNRYGISRKEIPFKLVSNGFTTIMKEAEHG